MGQRERKFYMRAVEAFCVGYAVRVVCCTKDGNISLLALLAKKIITCNDEDKKRRGTMKLFFTWGLAVFALFVGLGCERVSLEDQIVVSEGTALDVVDTGGNRYRISRVEAYGALELMLRSIDGTMIRGG